MNTGLFMLIGGLLATAFCVFLNLNLPPRSAILPLADVIGAHGLVFAFVGFVVVALCSLSRGVKRLTNG